jgi:hypothetical protein
VHVPFQKMIDGFTITVAKNDAAIMVEDAAMEVGKKRIVGEKRKNDDADMMTPTSNK